MPKISALLHVRDSEHQLGRALETLRVCDEIIVVDHHSQDRSAQVAREYGASVIEAVSGVENGAYATDCKHDWVLCIRPEESISELLEASLHEWKSGEPQGNSFSVGIREQHGSEWRNGAAETRLVNRSCVNWTADLPPDVPGAPLLAGDILRIAAEENK